MGWERNENFNDNQIKGIDLTIKAITKKYPFIKGWKFIDNYQKWKSSLYLNIIVDWFEVGKFYGKEIKPYYEESIKNGEWIESSIIDSYMFKNPSSTDSGFQEFFDKSYTESKKISTLLNTIYSSLPSEFQIMMTFKSSIDFFKDNIIPVELYIEHFVSGEK